MFSVLRKEDDPLR
ncbi:putative membrane protein, partial [Chlamydia psittaci 84-8471/1]